MVHLTGYNIQDEEGGPSMMFESEESSEEEEEVPALTNGKKRKAASGDESSSPAKKKANKEPSPLDKLLAEKRNGAPNAKEEKKQAEDMAKKIAATIKVCDFELKLLNLHSSAFGPGI